VGTAYAEGITPSRIIDHTELEPTLPAKLIGKGHGREVIDDEGATDLIYAMGRDSVCGRARLAGARMILTRHLHALCSTCRAGYPRRLERPTMSLGGGQAVRVKLESGR